MCEQGQQPPGAGVGAREATSRVAEEQKFGETVQSRRYQVTVWLNGKACSDTGATTPNTGTDGRVRTRPHPKWPLATH